MNNSSYDSTHTKLTKRFLWILVLLASALLLIGCGDGSGLEAADIGVEVEYHPPVIPLRISIDTQGNITVAPAAVISTPLGTFEVKAYASHDLFPDRRTLTVRFDGQDTVYELTEGTAFKVEFNDSLYESVVFEQEQGGDIFLELRSAHAGTGPSGDGPSPTSKPKSAPSSTSAGAVGVSTTPKTCNFAAQGLFAGIWQAYQDQLGCPLERQPRAIEDSEQPFEKGHMFWRKDNYWTYVVYKSGPKAGFYERYTGWNERDYNCPYDPPDNRIKPERGFGWVWCTQIQEPVTTMGWGLAPEMGFGPAHGDPLVQEFERGFIFRDSDGKTVSNAHIYFDSGTFTREDY